MPRMGNGVQKPKNLKKALGKLASYCKKEVGIIVLALILAAAGTVLTIIGPNQISKITDYIYDGLTGGDFYRGSGSRYSKAACPGTN